MAPFGVSCRNLTNEVSHPSRIKAYSQDHKLVIEQLIKWLKYHAESGKSVCVTKSFHHVVFCLLILMRFGERLDEIVLREIKDA